MNALRDVGPLSRDRSRVLVLDPVDAARDAWRCSAAWRSCWAAWRSCWAFCFWGLGEMNFISSFPNLTFRFLSLLSSSSSLWLLLLLLLLLLVASLCRLRLDEV